MSVPDASAPRPLSVSDDVAERFEAKRLDAMRRKRARTLPAALATLALGGALFAVLPRFGLPWFFALAGTVSVGGGLLAWWDKPRRDYRDEVKDHAIPAALSGFGQGWQYAREGRIDLARLKRSRILPSYDKARQEDVITGRHEDVYVELAELKLTEQRGSGKSRRTVTTFDGLAVRFVVPRPFEAHTLVLRRFGTPGLFSGLDRVRLETSEFEREFNVYSTDQVAARVVLTVTMMERLVALSEDMMRLGGGSGSSRLQAAFWEDQVLLLVPCAADLFEPKNLDRPYHLREDMARLRAEIADVLGIADALRLAA